MTPGGSAPRVTGRAQIGGHPAANEDDRDHRQREAHGHRVEPLADREREQDVDRAAETLAEAADLAADAAVATDAAARDALLSRRRTLLSGVVEIYASRPHVAAAVAEARRLLSTPESTP
jgi:hypothetical protein